MIIQALNDYYNRLKEDSEVAIPMFGFSIEKISFALVLSEDGKLLQVDDLRDKRGKKPVPKSKLVPTVGSRSSDINPNFMWDNTKYVLGRSKEKKEVKKFEAFKKLQHSLCDDIEDKGVKAVLRFLDSWGPDYLESSKCYNDWKDMADTNIIFQLDGVNEWVHDRKSIQEKWEAYFPRYFTKKDQPIRMNICLASGNKEPIAQKHIIPIKGVGKDQASMVSFNRDSFCSYNKNQSYNAPVSERIVFNYATTLNFLLQFDSKQKVQVGDSTTVFWAEGNTPVAGLLKDILDPKPGQPSTKELKVFLDMVRDGRNPRELTDDTKNLKFYILGLSPNKGRLSVRFWYVDTVEGISMKIGQHFDDLRIVKRPEYDREYPGIWHLLHELELKKKDDKGKRKKIKDISPLLAGAFFRSIITGAAYPHSILAAVIQRIRATQEVNYLRAALIKAYLNRKNRIQKNNKEVTMALNENETNTGYLLGRLFAALEKAQKDAVPGANSTIKDRFYGSASATPSTVFPQLIRLAQHHIQKSKYGSVIEKRISEIIQDIQAFPPHLNLEDQGMFAIGYYHQQPELYKKTKKENE